MGLLARRLERALPEALAQADRAWDQVDSLTVLDPAIRHEAALLAGRASAMRERGDGVSRAAAREVLLTLDETLALVQLVERRLATLARLRLRAGEALVDADGRPFLDLAAALSEAARAWA